MKCNFFSDCQFVHCLGIALLGAATFELFAFLGETLKQNYDSMRLLHDSMKLLLLWGVFIGALVLSVGLVGVQLFFLKRYRHWLAGNAPPSGEGINMLATVSFFLSGVIVLLIACSDAGGGMRAMTWFTVAIAQLQIHATNTMTSRRLKEVCDATEGKHFYLCSVHVDGQRPRATDSAIEAIAAIRTFSHQRAKAAFFDMCSAFGAYRFQLSTTIATSAFSMVAVAYNILTGQFEDAGNDSLIAPMTFAVVALVCAGKTIVDCILSLLHDHGYPWAPEDRSMRQAVFLKTLLTADKVVLTYQQGLMGKSGHDMKAYTVLVTSTLLSFLTSVFLSWSSLKSRDAEQGLSRKGQSKSQILRLYRTLWFASKGGMAYSGYSVIKLGFLMSGNRRPIIQQSEIDGFTLLFSANCLCFAAGTLLSNELRALLANPDMDFTATHCGSGARIAAKIVTFFAGIVALLDLRVGLLLWGLALVCICFSSIGVARAAQDGPLIPTLPKQIPLLQD